MAYDSGGQDWISPMRS
uniref:Uncharacterized protein n=1 Tax=Arundo donax TaxID=35708 RepID=A0A0A9BLR7_ARUDO